MESLKGKELNIIICYSMPLPALSLYKEQTFRLAVSWLLSLDSFAFACCVGEGLCCQEICFCCAARPWLVVYILFPVNTFCNWFTFVNMFWWSIFYLLLWGKSYILSEAGCLNQDRLWKHSFQQGYMSENLVNWEIDGKGGKQGPYQTNIETVTGAKPHVLVWG